MPTYTEPATFHYILCSEETGSYLVADRSEAPRVDDSACWLLLADGGGGGGSTDEIQLRNAVSGGELVVVPCLEASPKPARPGEKGRRVRSDDGSIWLLMRGPAALPSTSLAQLRDEGWTVLPALYPPSTIRAMKQAFDTMQTEKAKTEDLGVRVSLENIINHSACCAQAVVHPVALWLLEQTIGGPIHLGHSPICAVQKPEPMPEDPSARGLGGWHSDYPLNGAYQRHGKTAFPSNCLGCEFLTCVDAFTESNGATWIVPRSRDHNSPPPPSAATENPPGAEQLVAPAGSVLIFDIRTWHRSYWNGSGEDRCAILNNVLPQWVMPMMDQSAEYSQFVSSGLAESALTPRERQDASMLMQNIVQGKPIQTFEPTTARL